MKKEKIIKIIKCLLLTVVILYGLNKSITPVYATGVDDEQETISIVKDEQEIKEEEKKEEKEKEEKTVVDNSTPNNEEGKTTNDLTSNKEIEKDSTHEESSIGMDKKEEEKKEDDLISKVENEESSAVNPSKDENKEGNLSNNLQEKISKEGDSTDESTLNNNSSNQSNDLSVPINDSIETLQEEKKIVATDSKQEEITPKNINEEKTDDLLIDKIEEEKNEVADNKRSLSKSGTEHDVASFITSATVNTTQNGQSEYEVSEGTRYDIVLEFAETPTHQFPNDGTMVYYLPDGFDTSLIHDSGTFSVNVHTPDGTVTVRNNHYVVDGGKITINWSEDENVHTLFAANNAKFYIRFRAYFDGTEDEIPWNDVVITPLHFNDEESSLEMVKVSSPSLSTYPPKINYTISLTSTGVNNDININDSITGNGVTLIPSSFVVTSSTGSFIKDVDYTITPNGNSFTFNANKMIDGQIVTITYSASLDETLAVRDGDDVFYLSANNKATLKTEGHTDIIRETNDRIEIKPEIEKFGTIIDENHILWHVNINVNNKLLIKDMPVIDIIDPNSTSSMHFDTTQQFTIKVYNSAGNLIKTIPVSWSEILNNAGTGWTYLIPSDDNYYRYEFEYTTTYDNSGNDKVVENDVHFGDNDYSSGVYVHGESDINLEKKAKDVNLTDNTVTWEIVIHVPKVGLDSTNNVLKEQYPISPYIQGVGTVYEPIVNGSVTITGLLQNETYEIQYYDTYANIIFKKGGEAGLYSTDLPRDINITLKTVINEKWLEQASEQTYFINHTNTAIMGKTVTAIARIAPPMIVKSITDAPTVTIDGTNYPVYKYTVKTGMIYDDNFELNDTFDTSIFSMYIPTDPTLSDYLIMFGGDTYDNQTALVGGWNNPQRINYVDTATGLKFIITSDKLPKNGQDLYNYYSFSYYLIPKNLSSLRELMQRAATSNNATYEFENKIKYNDELEASVKGKYSYSALKKREVSFDADTSTVFYEIEVNPDALVLNDMGNITLVDTYDNMSIIYESITVTPSNGVVFDSSGNSITFTLPDAKSIKITYSARLIYEQPGQFETVRVDYSNTAALLTGTFQYTASVVDYKYVVSIADGDADVYGLNLLKYEAGNMNVRLAGAVFELLVENEDDNTILENVKDKNGNNVVFTSDINGKILIEGDQDLDGWSIIADKQYYLRETKAPEGYKIANFLYQFKVASNGKADYDHYIYYSGDTMTVKNYPGTDIFVEKEWENGADKHQSDIVTVKLQEKIGDGEWQDSSLDPITLSATNNWRGSFAGLPLITTINYNEVQISYRIVEFLVNGQPIDESKYTITLLDGNPTTYKIINKYELKGEAEISVLKVLNGRSWNNDDSFEFTITAADGTPLPTNTVVTITKNTTNYKDSFGKISYTEAGTYTYTIKETHKGETINGVKYDSTDKVVTFTLVDDGNGNLVLDPSGTASFDVTFTNEYSTKGEAEISVLKVLNGRSWNNDDSFEFTITTADGTPLPTNTVVTITKNTTNYKDSFGKISYTEAGTYTYTIKETHKGETINGVKYDSTDKVVTFTLVDDGNGNLVLDPSGTASFDVTFTNEYSTKGEAEISVLKVLNGRSWNNDDSFEFTITAADGTPMPGTTTITITKDSTGYKESFGKINFTEEGTYTYTITETHKGETIDGIVYDSQDKTVTFTLVDDGNGKLVLSPSGNATFEVTFRNEYTTKGEAEISVLKVLNGRSWNNDDSFEFTITAADGTPMPGTTTITITKDSTGYKESFGKINFTEEGTYTYTITETHKGETIDGIVYDSQDKTVTFTLVDDGNGKLVLSPSGNATFEVTFRNEYTANGEITFCGKKTLSGKTLVKEMFEFELLDANGEVLETVKNNANGTFAFSKITYSLDDLDEDAAETTKTYKIREVKGNISGVTYDETVYNITVTLKDLGNGTISAVSNPTETSFKFTNEYTATGEITFSGKKTLSGKTLAKDMFEFELLDADGEVIETVKNNADGTFSFSKITYSLDDLDEDAEETTKTYKIREVKGSLSGVTYDETVYNITVTLKDLGNGTISAVSDPTETTFEFTNEYTATGEITFSGKKTLDGKTLAKDMFEFELLDADGEVIETVKNNADGTFTFSKITYSLDDLDEDAEETTKTYKIREVKGSLSGVSYDETVYNITVTLKDLGNGTISAVSNPSETSFAFTNKYTKRLSVTKIDITTKKEVAGAKLQIVDSKNNVVEEWISTTKAHVVEGLKTGEKYTLKEIVAPEGYKVTTDSTFTIDENGEVTTTGHTTTDEEGNIVLLVEDAKTIVRITKIDITTKKEVAGAKLQIVDSKNNIVEEWVSTKETHVVEGLKTGEKYTLKEIVAPEGYKVTTDSTFTIDENGEVTTTGHTTTDEEGNIVLLVEDTKTIVRITKIDITTKKEVAGAKLQIVDSNNKVVEEWVSTEETHIVEGLKTGEKYTLKEIVAPEGYKVTTDSTFTIDENGKVTTTGHTTTDEEGNIVLLVEDTKTIVRITKIDITTKKEVVGAKLQIVDSNNKVVEEWISTEETHIVEGLKTGEKYTLKEIVAPEGYTVTTDSTFTINENGEVTTTGHTTTDKEGNIVLLVEDTKTKVYISKVDKETGEDLEGATIQILDSKGTIVEEWTTTKEVHLVEGLKVNEEYTVREASAPEGYDLAKDITFTIDEKGNITTIGSTETDKDGNTLLLVQDYKIPTTPTKNPQTADYFEVYVMLFNLFVLGFVGGVTYLRKYNQA